MRMASNVILFAPTLSGPNTKYATTSSIIGFDIKYCLNQFQFRRPTNSVQEKIYLTYYTVVQFDLTDKFVG